MSSLDFRFKKLDVTRNYLVEEINYYDLISQMYKKTCKCLNYAENLLILVSTITYHSCICFISLCSCWYYKFCSRNKNLCNHCQL